MTTCTATVRSGQLVLEKPLDLPDGTRVTVLLETANGNPLRAFVENAVESGVSDFAEQHDHYVYGSPKRA